MSDEEKKVKESAQITDEESTKRDVSTAEKKAEIRSDDKTTKPDETISSFSLLDADAPKTSEKSTFKVEEVESDAEAEIDEVQEIETEVIETSEKEPEQSKNISSDEVKDWLKDVRPDTTKEQEKGGGGSIFKWLAVFMILLLIAGAVAGGIYYYNQNVTQIGEVEEVIVDEVIKDKEEETEPTLAPEEVDLSIFSINVLNGSGVAGEAGKVATTLSNAGFASPNAGNADKQNYTDTIIKYKATIPQSVIDEVISALEDSYSIEMSDDVLEEEGEYDIIVTVGQGS